MKKVTFIITVLIILLVACNSPEISKNKVEPMKKLVSEQDKTYVGFAIDTLKEQRWYRDKEAFESEVESLGGRVKTLASNSDSKVQIEQIRLLLNEGVDILVVVPANASNASEIANLANEAEVPIISYDRLILDGDIDYYISFDNEKVGKLQAEYITSQLSEGNIAYVGGAESDNNAKLLRKGTMGVLDPSINDGSYNLVYDQYTTDWSPSIAREQIGEFINETNVTIDAVIAANDGTAGGAIQALDDNNSHNIPITGQDAELDAIRRIVNGTQAMTVYKPIKEIAEKAASIAMTVANGETVETDVTINNNKIDVPTILLDPIIVDKTNIEETIVADEFHTESEIYE